MLLSKQISAALFLFLFVSALHSQKKVPANPTSKHAAPAKEATAPENLALKGAYPIVELIAIGSERFEADDVIKATGLKVDKTTEVPLDRVREAAERLVATGAFAQVNYRHTASRGGMKVEFELGDKDDDQFIKCEFGNIVWIPESELLIELHDRVPLFNGTVPRDGTLAEDVAKAIEAIVKEKGVNVSVANEHQDPLPDKPASERMTYRAADVEVKIARVETAGASLVMKDESSKISNKLVGLIYNRSTVSRFIEHNLRNLYLQHGYLRATFGAPAIQVISNAAQKTDIAISIPVTDGRTYTLGALRWSGNKTLTSKALDAHLHLSSVALMDGTRLNKDLDNVRRAYATLGFLHMTVTPSPQFEDASGTVNYVMEVNEGDLFQMGKFDVEGLQNMSAERMRRAWTLREGDPFNALYVGEFLKKFRLPAGTNYVVEESEGERPKSVDVTVIFCLPNEPCKPKNENHLYSPPEDDDAKPR